MPSAPDPRSSCPSLHCSEWRAHLLRTCQCMAGGNLFSSWSPFVPGVCPRSCARISSCLFTTSQGVLQEHSLFGFSVKHSWALSGRAHVSSAFLTEAYPDAWMRCLDIPEPLMVPITLPALQATRNQPEEYHVPSWTSQAAVELVNSLTSNAVQRCFVWPCPPPLCCFPSAIPFVIPALSLAACSQVL